jgi:hypothetical protein
MTAAESCNAVDRSVGGRWSDSLLDLRNGTFYVRINSTLKLSRRTTSVDCRMGISRFANYYLYLPVAREKAKHCVGECDDHNVKCHKML